MTWVEAGTIRYQARYARVNFRVPDRGSVNPTALAGLGSRRQQCRLSVWNHTNVVATRFGTLRKRYWGQHLWARGYWVASSGNVTDEVWAEYIKNQTPPEPDDDFRVI